MADELVKQILEKEFLFTIKMHVIYNKCTRIYENEMYKIFKQSIRHNIISE